METITLGPKIGTQDFQEVYTISDLHVDYAHNLKWIDALDAKLYRRSVLIIAGDLTDDPTLLAEVLKKLRSIFGMVFFTPGNHELWVRKQKNLSSLQKLEQILELCKSLDVKTEPTRVNDVQIVPLFSWYDGTLAESGFDTSKPVEGWSDDYFCKWGDLQDVNRYLLGLNESRIKNYATPVISFSHFLPRTELLPPSRFLFFKDLHRVSGSRGLEEQVRSLGSRFHIFGHTHIPFSKKLEGCHYFHGPLGYPDELPNRLLAPVFVASTIEGVSLRPEPLERGFGIQP